MLWTLGELRQIDIMIAEKEIILGRPRKYKSPEEMQKRIDDYFEGNDKPTICGLTLALGFVERKALLNYEGYSKAFYATIKRAKTVVERYYERNLAINTRATGSIFALKNFDWTDKQEISYKDSPFRLNITLPPVQLPEAQPCLQVVSRQIIPKQIADIEPKTQIDKDKIISNGNK